MFLRSKRRCKDGQAHRYFSVVENHRVGAGRVGQRQVLFWGEINDSQQAAWRQPPRPGRHYNFRVLQARLAGQVQELALAWDGGIVLIRAHESRVEHFRAPRR